MKIRTAGALAMALLLHACTPTPPGSPAFPPPSLVSVALRGTQICGPFTTKIDGVFAFVCLPLPTTTASGWELNPDWYETPRMQLRSNKTALVTFTTVSTAEMSVTYRPPGGPGRVVRQIPAGPTAVAPDVLSGVEVSANDNGTVKTWTVRVHTSLCRDVAPLEFRTIGTNRPDSSPLFVTLLRAPSVPPEDRCATSGGGIGIATAGTPSSGSTSPPGFCMAGATRQTVFLCLQCPKNAPKGLWDAESDEVCSPSAYLAQRRSEKPTCDVWQVPNVEACILP